MFAEAWTVVRQITVLDVLDILLIAFMIYYVILLIRDTKAYHAAIGLAFIGALYLLTGWGRLGVSNRIFRAIIDYVIIAVIVLFQGDLYLGIRTAGVIGDPDGNGNCDTACRLLFSTLDRCFRISGVAGLADRTRLSGRTLGKLPFCH